MATDGWERGREGGRLTSPEELEVLEARLGDAARALDRSVDGLSIPHVVPLALGLRGWTLYRGMRRALAAEQPISGGILLRSVIDTTILVRWLEEDPGLRVDLWMAEDSRHRLALIEPVAGLRRRRGQPPLEVFPAGQVAEMQAEVRRARRRAVDAGLPINAKSGRVLPAIEQMAGAVDDLWEPYQIAYRVLSPITHAGGRSFASDTLEVRPDGTYIIPGSPFESHPLRLLAIPAVCMLLASVSRQVGLGVEAACDTLRMEAVLG